MHKIQVPEGYTVLEVEPGDAGGSIVAINPDGERWRTAVAPDDDVSTLPKEWRTWIADLMTPERRAKAEAAKVGIPPLEEDPGPSIEDRVIELERKLAGIQSKDERL